MALSYLDEDGLAQVDTGSGTQPVLRPSNDDVPAALPPVFSSPGVNASTPVGRPPRRRTGKRAGGN